MPNISREEQNQWVANLFESLLKLLESLDWQQEAPDLFLVYAHDNKHVPSKQADAEVARLVIKWLKQVGTRIYSDRSGAGNPIIPKTTPSDTLKVHDILSTQLGLLPSNQLTPSEDKRKSIVLCGSALLGHYFFSDYYQNNYYPGLKRAYQAAQEQANPAEARAKISAYVNSQLKEKNFHHVLTELAFLQIWAESEGASHDIVPLLLNGEKEEGFPEFITNTTTVRIEETVWRKSSSWNGQTTYEHEGLHVGFFKLLKRLWMAKEDEIQILGEGVYKDCLKALRSQQEIQSENAFHLLMLNLIGTAQRELINKNSATMRILELQKWFNRIEVRLREGKEKDHEFKIDKRLKEWYPSLTHRLAIQRVSGHMLLMERCYINLAVVEYQPKKIDKEEEGQLKQMFYRLPSVERVENMNLKEPISLEDLFKPKRLRSGNEGIPKRILIRGRAGIGKTTLAKKSLHDYLHHGLWREHFEWVLWIPLRHLKGKKGNYPLETLLYEEYFEQYRNGGDLAQALHRRIQAAPIKTLLICDGWDEVIHEELACLSELLNHPSVIITSRPHGINVNEIERLDLELETVGFSKSNVETYLNHRDIVVPEMAEEIKTFIKQHPFVRELVNIPIQLDALCYSWDEIRDQSPSAWTMTALYEGMIHKLWRKDIVRLNKSMDGKVLTKEQVQRIRQFRHLERHIKAESTCLGALALNGLHKNQLEFKEKDLEEVIQQLEKDCHGLPNELETNVMELSCLQVERQAGSFERISYQFLHLTFQEFFAAQWLVSCLEENKPLSLVESPEIRVAEFIREHQYNPRYEIVWWLMAGLLSGKALKGFFDQLNQGPQDLIGIQHQRLMMHCLKESNGKLPKEEQERLESDLYGWLMFEIEQVLSYGNTSSLGRQMAFPEGLLCKELQKAQSSDVKCRIARTLEGRPMLSDNAVRSLIELAKDEDKKVRSSVANALAQQSSLSLEGVRALIGLSQDKEGYVRKSAAYALGQQSSLFPAGIQRLIGLSKDKQGYVRGSAARALGKQSSLSPEGVQTLIRLSRDEDKDTRDSAAYALGPLSRLSIEEEQTLIELSQEENEGVRDSAAKALGKQSSLSPEGVQALIKLLKDRYLYVKSSAAAALGKQSSLSSEGVQTLIRLLKDEEFYVRQSASYALVKQLSLSPEGVQHLIGLSQDEDKAVRSLVANALGQQSNLSLEGMQILIALAKDGEGYVRSSVAAALGRQSLLSSESEQALISLLKDEEDYVKRSAAYAFGQQSSLPPESVPSLIECLEEENLSVRKSAANALGQESHLLPENVRTLIGLLKDKDKGVRESAVKALGKQSSLLPEEVQSLIECLKDENLYVRQAAVEALGQQSNLSTENMQTLIELFWDKEICIRSAAAKALGKQSSLSPEVVRTLIGLFQDGDSQIRYRAADALGQQASLSPGSVQSLLELSQHEDKNVQYLAVKALERQSVSHGYRALLTLTKNPSFIEELYRYWLIPSNFEQASSLYIADKKLCFYTAKGLKTIDLNEQGADFRQAILKAQQAIGIPEVSQIKTQSTAWMQARASCSTFFSPAMPGAWPTMSTEHLAMDP